MRRFLISLVCAVSLTLTGCAGGWLEQAKSPIERVQDVLSTVDTVLHVSQLVFSQVLPLLSSADQPKASATFSQLMLTAARAKSALQSGLDVAVVAGQKKPDLLVLLAAVQKAADDLQAFLKALRGTGAASSAPVYGLEDLDVSVGQLRGARL